MNENFEKLQLYLDKNMAFNTALSLFSWDNETLAPKEAIENTSKVIGILSDEYFKSLINDDVKNLLNKLDKDKELTFIEKSILDEVKKEYNRLECIPSIEYRLYNELISKSTHIWSRAKKENNFEIFAPCLKEILKYKRNFAKYRTKNGKNPYNKLLDDFEEGFTTKILDDFFDKLKKEIIPLIKQISEKNYKIDKHYNYLKYSKKKQEKFSRWLSKYVGFDFNRGVFGESEHAFTNNLHNKDVRITTHYCKKNLESAIFSTIHETGHAIYEMGIDDNITQTLVSHPTYGMHESQSRFFENIIGRSEEFWKPIYGKLQKLYDKNLKDVSLEQFIKGINKSQPSLIRTEADELTYPLHIIIRYEIEKSLFNNEIEVEDLPQKWNEKYEQYLGVKPKTDAEGVLQDIHWSNGDFGYFPSYAIGSAIAAQIFYHLKSIMSLDKYLLEQNIEPIKQYLNEHIHKYGKTKTTNELLIDMTGEKFNPDYYIKYLKEKFSKIYELDYN